MVVPVRKKSRKQPSGSRTAAFVVLLLIIGAVAVYFISSPVNKPVVAPPQPRITQVKPGNIPPPVPEVSRTEPATKSPLPYKERSDYPSPAPITKPERSGPAVAPSGRLAIIIDDMGSSLSEARSLAAIKVPLTFAIIPGLRADKNVAAYATTNNIETMIHIPMQPKGWPARRLESNGLLVSMDAEELQKRVSGFLQQFPAAIGVNNHMGSEFTEQEEKMRVVLQILKKNDLFFIDSVTSPESTGWRVAQQLGVKSARRNVFLDNEQDPNYILGQINQAIRMARKNGSAIAICHPHPVTIATLAATLPRLAGQGVQLIPVSQLVK
ncbi:MAG: divergent polysaccharide deacetylase family protein [Proteobacteria bacterium]|nr:divergent polysaccharide deacetylase family protein [Pseudomonadota bacterium]